LFFFYELLYPVLYLLGFWGHGGLSLGVVFIYLGV